MGIRKPALDLVAALKLPKSSAFPVDHYCNIINGTLSSYEGLSPPAKTPRVPFDAPPNNFSVNS